LLRKIRAVWRAVRLALHVLTGYSVIRWRFPRIGAAQQHARIQQWAADLLRHAGVTVQVCGQPRAPGPVLLVANHISW
ncbi:hypothetical protein RAD10_42555, partial [Bradyrhizobium sp. 23AC]